MKHDAAARCVAMENALFSLPELDWSARCAAVAEAGFGGIYAVPYPLVDDDFARLRDLAAAPARHGLRLSGVYANIDLALPPEHPMNVRVARLFSEQNGAPRVELSFKCSDIAAAPAALDDAIVARIEPLLAVAERRGFDLAIYPHSFYPLETPAHAARLARRLAHPRLGYLFPVSHVYAVSSFEQTLAQLDACAGEIVSFNLCGCRRAAPGPRAKCLHFGLDEGDFPVDPLLRVLRAADYRGEYILQGHGWTGDVLGRLRRSARRLQNALGAVD